MAASKKVETEVETQETKGGKFGKQEKQKVAGVEYTFQFPGVKTTIDLLDRSRNAFGNVVDGAYYEEIMEHVIVSPKVDWDYWEEHDGLREVMNLADTFLGRKL